jgi:hypothetical protein
MSLKNQTKEIYIRYGLSDFEFEVYLVFLSQPQITVSEVAGILEKDLQEIKLITEKLCSINFIKKIEGIIDRYIPLEPFFELFVSESAKFRDEISKIKDTVLSDQSIRFANLDSIQNSSLETIDTSVKTAVEDIFKKADQHDVDKKSKIEEVQKRFDDTCKPLEDEIQRATFESRDRFIETRTEFTENVKNTTEGARDRLESSLKSLEGELHEHLDEENQNFKNQINLKHDEAVIFLDNNTSKFSTDNLELNNTLALFSDNHISQTKKLEDNLHVVLDQLNTKLKNNSEGFKTKFDDGIQNQKTTLNQIVDDLLVNFKDRVQKLEIECKQDLDEHVEHHREHADNLKPQLEEILEKYIFRFKKIIDDLKTQISGMLAEHIEHFENSNENLRNNLNESINTQHSDLAGQVLSFKSNTVGLIDNLQEISASFGELTEQLAKRGSAFKSLLFGKHKLYKEKYEEVKERIEAISGSMRENFEDSTANYIKVTGDTTSTLTTQINEITESLDSKQKANTESLDSKQKDTIDAEFEGLAGELSSEIDKTLKHNVEHCQKTTTKLKDSLENSLHTHRDDYELNFNKHRQTGLKYNDDSNTSVQEKVNEWFENMDRDHERAKTDISVETNNQIRDITGHLKDNTDKNDSHSYDFEKEVKDVKTDYRATIDDLIRRVDDDFRECKTKISGKINPQIELFKNEVATINETQQNQVNGHIERFKEIVEKLDEKQHHDLDEQMKLFAEDSTNLEQNLHTMIEEHKTQYQEISNNLQQELDKTITDNIQNTKDAIADFTLSFMNVIDEGIDIAEENENKLNDINQKAASIQPLGESGTWHVFGTKALLESIIDAMKRVKSTITIITPTVEPKILEALSEVAYVKKSVRFLYTTTWDLATFGPIIQKMKVLGNIQFRNLKNANDFYAVSRDGEEIVLCPKAKKEEDLIAIVSVQDGYAQIFSSFIYPIFQANSRPI